jgi:hypothetical protein
MGYLNSYGGVYTWDLDSLFFHELLQKMILNENGKYDFIDVSVEKGASIEGFYKSNIKIKPIATDVSIRIQDFLKNEIINGNALYEIIFKKNAFSGAIIIPPAEREEKSYNFLEKHKTPLSIRYFKKYIDAVTDNGIVILGGNIKDIINNFSIISRSIDIKEVISGTNNGANFEIYYQYDKCIVIGIKRPSDYTPDDDYYKTMTYKIDLIKNNLYQQKYISFNGENNQYNIPETDDTAYIISDALDETEMINIINLDKNNGINFIVSKCSKGSEKPKKIKVLNMPNRSHIGLLLTSGMINGPFEQNGEKFYVKGQVKKVKKDIVNDSGIITKKISFFETSIKILKDNKIYTLK